MVLDLILKMISEAQERQRRAEQERAIAAGIPMALIAPAEPKKKKKKKRRQESEDAVAAPPAQRRVSPSVEEMLPTLPTVADADRAARDLPRLFVLSEVLGPPLALRDEDPL